MAKLYFAKIRNGEINLMTGEIWTINDVPVRWHDEVEQMLDDDIES